MQFTLEEWVLKFGTKQQIASLKKGKGNINKRTFDSISKESMRYYEMILVDGIGSKRVITCLGEKKCVTHKLDNRCSNGAWSIPYTKNLDILVANKINIGIHDSKPLTLTQWSLEFGLYNEKMTEILKVPYDYHVESMQINNLIDSGVIKKGEERALLDYAQILKQSRKELVQSLKRMEKADIIELIPKYNGHVSTLDTIISISENTFNSVTSLKEQLMKKYGVTEWYLQMYKSASKTKNFLTEYKSKLANLPDEISQKPLGLDYVYISYEIKRKLTTDSVKVYLQTFGNVITLQEYECNRERTVNDNIIQYHSKKNESIIKTAIENEEKFLKPRVIKRTLPEFGGKDYIRKPIIFDFNADLVYYDLYFSQKYSSVIQDLHRYYS